MFVEFFHHLGAFILLIICTKCYHCEEVTVEQGRLLGSTYSSRNGTQYYGFLGIPFAKPPVAELRFEPPQTPNKWSGVRNATSWPAACIQKLPGIYSGIIFGEEDCLYLNVFIPKKKKQPLPVMMFIHGGSFIFGSSAGYDPSYFMDHQIIIVTIQYRLGILGFLSTGDSVLPGNNGMKDQVMALKWVQKNIAAFGGDPNQVTIFGNSAGAVSVHYHMYSSLTKGLFHRAISQSGTSLSPWAYEARDVAHQKAMAIGLITGCPTKRSENLVKCLRRLPAEEFVHTIDKLQVWNEEPFVLIAVVLEPSDVEDAYITEYSWYHDAPNQVPWITGINSAEGAFQALRYSKDNGKMVKILNKSYRRFFPIVLYYKFWIEDQDKIDHITESVKNFYFPNKSISLGTPLEIIQMFTDFYFFYGSVEAAKRHNTTVYYYLYDHRNERTYNEIYGKHHIDLGVCHCDELISLFHLNGLFPNVTQGNDLKVSERMVKYWVNFASTGNPNDKGVSLWTPVQSDDFEYFHITTKADTMEKGLWKERYSMWKNLQVMPTPSSKLRNCSKSSDEL